MKTFLTFLTITSFGLPVFGQLVIEGGPFGTQISNRDGKIEGAVSSSNRDEIIQGRSFSNLTSNRLISNSTIRGNATGTGFSIVPSRGTLSSIPVRPKVSPIGIPTRQVIDVRQLQQLQKIERDLAILKTTRESGMEFRVHMLFPPSQAYLNRSARSLLDQVVAYMAMTGGKAVTVQYYYQPGSDSPLTGRHRASAAVNYLSEKSGLSLGWFTTPEPRPTEPYMTASVLKISIQR